MIYNQVVSALNVARLRGVPFPIVHALIEASLSANAEVCLHIANAVDGLI